MRTFTIIAILLLTTTEVFGLVAPSLGSVASFAVYTVTGAIGNLGTSVIEGDIGRGISGAVSGFPPGRFTGSKQLGNPTTQ